MQRSVVIARTRRGVSPTVARSLREGASGCQDHLERQAAQLAGRQEGDAARHLADLSRQLVSELVRKSDDRNGLIHQQGGVIRSGR